MNEFIEARQAYQRLQTKYAVGKLGKADFEKAVAELAIRDPWGDLWQIGVASGEWYRFDGVQWLRDYPPPDELLAKFSSTVQDFTSQQTGQREWVLTSWYLIIENGNLAGKRIPMEQKLVLGRSRGNNVHLDDDLVSREHAVIEKSGSDYRLIDRGSKNGTELNGSMITRPEILKHGDRIRIGDTTLRVESDADAEQHRTAIKPKPESARPVQKYAPVHATPSPQPAPMPSLPPPQPPMPVQPLQKKVHPAPVPRPPKRKRRGCVVTLVILAVVVFCLGVVGFGGYWLYTEYITNSIGATTIQQAQIDVENRTDFAICALYMSDTNSAEWGNSLLTGGETIPAGSFVSFFYPVGSTIDVLAEDCNGIPLDVISGIYVPAEGITITYSPVP